MSYKENLIKLDKIVAQSDIADEYRCVWYGDIPVFSLFKDDESFLKGELHEVVTALERMIPPTAAEFAETLNRLLADDAWRTSGRFAQSLVDAEKMVERYEATKPTSDEDLSIFG